MAHALTVKVQQVIFVTMNKEQWEKEFDKGFCKVYPDGSSRFLRSVHENSDVEIKAFIKKTRADDKERMIKMLNKERDRLQNECDVTTVLALGNSNLLDLARRVPCPASVSTGI